MRRLGLEEAEICAVSHAPRPQNQTAADHGPRAILCSGLWRGSTSARPDCEEGGQVVGLSHPVRCVLTPQSDQGLEVVHGSLDVERKQGLMVRDAIAKLPELYQLGVHMTTSQVNRHRQVG